MAKSSASNSVEPMMLFCPFDGGEAVLEDSGPGGMFPAAVVCASCQCRTPYVRTPAIAVKLWNRRIARKPAKRVAKKRIP